MDYFERTYTKKIWQQLNGGILGCGDVTEVKSGPAFKKVPNSELVAVMRRDREKVIDYAKRHGVPKWYTDADELINDPDVNAIYIATPPLQHEEYTIAALKAGKPVYVEKPMAIDSAAAERMTGSAQSQKLCVAHYRRAQPLFIKLKELIESGMIGEIRCIDLKFLRPSPTTEELLNPKLQWRVDPAIAGGGLFHDLAPHQLDLMLYFFGNIKNAAGLSSNQLGLYPADDIVCGNIIFKTGIVFQGIWCFNVPKEEAKDQCEIIGSEGKISFSVFGEPEIAVTKKGSTSRIIFEKLEHVQQPMIERVVRYFLDESENPSPPDEGLVVMQLIDAFTGK